MISQPVQFSTDKKEFTTHKHMVIRRFTAFRGKTTHTNRLTCQRNAPAGEDELPARMVECAHRNGRILHLRPPHTSYAVVTAASHLPPVDATGLTSYRCLGFLREWDELGLWAVAKCGMIQI
jgi:hypothetical protein